MKSCKAILVVCLSFFAVAAAQQNGDIRLGDATEFNKGRLEVYTGGSWGTICYDLFKKKEGFGQVACRQLGYADLVDIGTVEMLQIPQGTGPVKLTETYCPFKKDPRDGPQHIFRCDYLDVTAECSHADDMAIECVSDSRKDNPYDTMVDLVDDVDTTPFTSKSSGLAQVYVNGEWGPVCNMEKEDADSLCRQLSYTEAVSVEGRNMTSDAPEVLDSFSCSSVQPCLRNCFSYPQPNAPVNCNKNYSYVTCTYNEENLFTDYGTKSSCTISNSGRVAGAVIGTLIILATIVSLAVALVCLFYPGCTFYRVWEGKKNPSALKISTGSASKYESI